jgi:5-methylcytosine-specific restriction endonuclease McrA
MKSQKNPLRILRPSRTCTRTYASYRSFKRPLQADFNSRCGYCDAPDSWDGGYKHYHIDHFIPKTQLRTITQNEYRNLVYACFSCNNSKGEDWPSANEAIAIIRNQGYIDPCLSRYDKQFYREKLGDIVSKTKVGQYMLEKLKLGLKRHAIIWILDKLDQQIKSLSVAEDKSTITTANKRKVNSHVKKLKSYYYEYVGVLQNENNA